MWDYGMRILKKVINGCMACLLITTGWTLGTALKAESPKIVLHEIVKIQNFKLTEEYINENF